MEVPVTDYILLARQLTANECYREAFEVYLVVLNRNRNLAVAHEGEVRDVLLKLNSELAISDRMDEIFDNFEKVMKIYPNNAYLLNEIGKYLFKYGYYKEAWQHFEKVLHLNHNSVDAEKNLNSVKNLLVERWHFRMLNDNLRNEYYRKAIEEEIGRDSDKVLDIGTGTGILAIFARIIGGNDIVACDGSKIMTEMAQLILLGNRLTNIRIINKMSTSMNYGDLKGPGTLLLTEMFDAGLFGEHVLQMLQHAWPNLLARRARVIPNAGEFYIIGAQCDHLNQKYQLGTAAKKLLNLFDMSIHIMVPNETYDCEDVHLIKDIKYLTKPQTVVNVNFNDRNDIDMNLSRTKPYEVDLNVTDDGVVNIYIGWFNLYVSDSLTITTDPTSNMRANAWQQAVFYDELPKTVKKNDSYKLEFLMNGGRLTMKPLTNAKIIRVSPEIIRFLNDEEYLKTIIHGIPMACIYLGQIADISLMDIIDLAPFPLFGMHMMKRGANTLICCARNESDKKFIEDVFKKNETSLANVTILLGCDWSMEVFGDEKYHAVFSHILELGGDVDTHMKDIAVKLKEKHLYNGGLFMPANMWIVGQLVSSRWLDINNKVFDENVKNIKIGEYINKYSVNVNYFIDFSTLKYVPMSNPVRVCLYPEGRLIAWNTTPIINNGHANAILCSYEIEIMQNLQMISTNRPNSFIDGMLFMPNCKQTLSSGGTARIIQFKDEEGAFKLVFNLSVS